MLEVKNLNVSIGGRKILDDLDLTVGDGEVAALMGPNGSGKSTLSHVIAGRKDYIAETGDVLLNGESILNLEPEARAAKGLFLAFQYPVEIPGVATLTFLKAALNAQRKQRGQEELSTPAFMKCVRASAGKLEINQDMLKRALNAGFSGGEKKRMEILQMALLEPAFAILDETDFGPRHRRLAGGRRWRQCAAVAKPRFPHHYPLPACSQPRGPGHRACDGAGSNRPQRRQGIGGRTGKKRIPRLCRRTGRRIEENGNER